MCERPSILRKMQAHWRYAKGQGGPPRASGQSHRDVGKDERINAEVIGGAEG